MKKSILLFLFILLAVSVFAKDKKLFEKNTGYSFLGFYESKNPEETNNYKYYIVINEKSSDNELLIYAIFSNNYEKSKDFTTKIYEAGNKIKMFAFYPDFYLQDHDDLIFEYEKTDIDSKNNMIIKKYYYVLE